MLSFVINCLLVNLNAQDDSSHVAFYNFILNTCGDISPSSDCDVILHPLNWLEYDMAEQVYTKALTEGRTIDFLLIVYVSKNNEVDSVSSIAYFPGTTKWVENIADRVKRRFNTWPINSTEDKGVKKTGFVIPYSYRVSKSFVDQKNDACKKMEQDLDRFIYNDEFIVAPLVPLYYYRY